VPPLFPTLFYQGTFIPVRTRLQMKSVTRALETSVELPGVSESRPVAFPVSTPPPPEEPVFVYSPLRGEWIIGLFAGGRWFDRATGDEVERPTHWMRLPGS
jgi:hypothetical protein